MWKDFVINGKTITESDFTIRFPQSSIFFIDFDKLKNHFSLSYGINDTPSSSDCVCIGLSQNKCCCYIIEAKNFDRIQNLKDEKILNKLEISLSKKLVDTLLKKLLCFAYWLQMSSKTTL